MAYTTITFEHPETNAVRVAPVGFSWTVLFFAFFPPLLRNDWKYAAIMFAACLISLGWSNLVFMFIYNRLYIEELVNQGYLVVDTPYPDLHALRQRLRLNLRTMAEARSAPPSEAPPFKPNRQSERGPWREEQEAAPEPPLKPKKPRQRSNVPRISLPDEEEEQASQIGNDAPTSKR